MFTFIIKVNLGFNNVYHVAYHWLQTKMFSCLAPAMPRRNCGTFGAEKQHRHSLGTSLISTPLRKRHHEYWFYHKLTCLLVSSRMAMLSRLGRMMHLAGSSIFVQTGSSILSRMTTFFAVLRRLLSLFQAEYSLEAMMTGHATCGILSRVSALVYLLVMRTV